MYYRSISIACIGMLLFLVSCNKVEDAYNPATGDALETVKSTNRGAAAVIVSFEDAEDLLEEEVLTLLNELHEDNFLKMVVDQDLEQVILTLEPGDPQGDPAKFIACVEPNASLSAACVAEAERLGAGHCVFETYIDDLGIYITEGDCVV